MRRCEDCFGLFDETFAVCPHCGYVQKGAADQVYQLNPGDILNERYIIGRVLGFGGFGNTYKAWDTKLETVVAIKEYYPSGMVNRLPGTRDVILFTRKKESDYQYGRRNFLEEARNMAKFSGHPNIVEVFHYFEENNTAYFVMEYLDGASLGAFLKQNGGKIPPDTALVIAEAICNALAAIHTAGIIHRDVSPDNIFICADNRIKLIDFGAARFSQQDKKLSIILKPGFAPPEQYDSVNDQGPWTDIYALGATLYMALTGIKPDESTNRKISDTVKPPKELESTLSENLSNTVMKAIAVDQYMRFRSVADLKKALLGEKKIIPLAKERRRRKNRRLFSVLAAILLVVTAGGFVLKSWIDKSEEQQLRPATISVWYSVEEGSREAAAMENIRTQFTAVFPDVTVELTAIPESEYAQRLTEAAESGTLPSLFESTGLDASVTEKAVELREILASEQAADCLFLHDYTKAYDDYKKIPLAVNIPVAYVITNGNAYSAYTAETWDSVTDFDAEIAMEESARKLWENTWGDAAPAFLDPDRFYDAKENEAAVLLATTADYNRVRETLTGYTKHCSFYTGGRICAAYTYEWSVGDGSEEEERAAKRLLTWMLGAPFQNTLMISTCQDGQIPLNQTCYQEKCSGGLKPLRELQDQIDIGGDE